VEFLPIDLDEVEWLREQNHHQPQSGSFVADAPAIFERYLRILHPLQIQEGQAFREVPWAEVTGVSGSILTATSQLPNLPDIRHVPATRDCSNHQKA
jgi:hypothetical protein